MRSAMTSLGVIFTLILVPVIAYNGVNVGGSPETQFQGLIEHCGRTGHFVENLGQWDGELLFRGEMTGGQIGFGSGCMLMNLITEYPDQGSDVLTQEGFVIEQDFIGSAQCEPTALDLLPGLNNYFYGNNPDGWVSGARSYGTISYQNLWDGIDLQYRLTSKGPKYEFKLKPGSDPDIIRIGVKGHRGLTVHGSGLEITLSDDISVMDTGLIAYYEDDLERLPISFTKIDRSTYGFSIGEFDGSRTVIIDPLLKSTFLGGSGGENPHAIRMDENGDVYIIGTHTSSNFPTTPGAYSTNYAGGWNDGFITKINSTFKHLEYSTMIGGVEADSPQAIHVEDGIATVGGYTNSKDFPVTSGVYNDTFNSGQDIFVLQLNETGGDLLFSTFVNGEGWEQVTSLLKKEDGNFIISGGTNSTDFPTTSGAYQEKISAGTKSYESIMFILNGTGTDLLYSTYLGGSDYEAAAALALDPLGRILLYGHTTSTDFPTTTGCYSDTRNGSSDLYVVRFDENMTDLDFGTYYGGAGYDTMGSILVSEEGDIFLSGYTYGIQTTTGAFDETFNGDVDAFITRFDPNCTNVKACTYLGGDDDERSVTIGFDDEENIFVYGTTISTDFPKSTGAYDETFNGTNNQNLFLSKLDSDLSTLLYSTFLGGDGYDSVGGFIVESPFKAVAAGLTSSTDFHVLSGFMDCVQDQPPADAFIIELSLLSPPTPPGDLTFNRGDDWVHLYWEPPMDDGGKPVTEYRLYKGPRPGSLDILTTLPVETMEYNDTTITVDGEYFYAVRAVNEIAPSKPSNIIRVADIIRPWIVEDLTSGSAEPAEEFTFSVSVMDNAFIDKVFVEYSLGSESLFDSTMEGGVDGIFRYTTRLPDENFMLNYSFYLNDTSDNWFRGPWKEVPVMGNVDPIFGEDLTPEVVPAGERLRFSVIATDNDELREVKVEYWSPRIYRQNVTMIEKEGDIYEYIIKTPSNSLYPISYFFSARDRSGHISGTAEKVVNIKDVTGPQISISGTSQDATTGDQYTINAYITDNRGVSAAWVKYSINDMDFNITLEPEESSTSFTATLDIPNTVGILSFTLHGLDVEGNPSYLPKRTVRIVDNDPPSITEDASDAGGTSGGIFHFIIDAEDNIGITNAWVEYWFEDPVRLRTELRGSDPFSNEIPLPSDRIGTMSYYLSVEDGAGNTAATEITTVDIEDVLPPYLISDLTPIHIGTGSILLIDALVHDDVGIDRVKCSWRQGAGTSLDIYLNQDNGHFKGQINVPVDSTDPINYNFQMLDQSGNSAQTKEKSVEVMDVISPVIVPIQDMEIGTTTEIGLVLDVEDNIGVESVSVENCPLPVTEDVIEGVITEPGIYPVTVEAVDNAGNRAEMTFVLTVMGSGTNGDDGDGGKEDEVPFWMFLLLTIGVLFFIGSAALFIYGWFRKDDSGKDGLPALGKGIERNGTAGPAEGIQGVAAADPGSPLPTNGHVAPLPGPVRYGPPGDTSIGPALGPTSGIGHQGSLPESYYHAPTYGTGRNGAGTLDELFNDAYNRNGGS